MNKYGINNARRVRNSGTMQKLVFLLPPHSKPSTYAHMRRKIVMVICQTLQCHMAAVGQSLEDGSDLISDWSAPFQLRHQVMTNIIPVTQLMTELEEIPSKRKAETQGASCLLGKWGELRSYWEQAGGSHSKKSTRLTCGIHAGLFWSMMLNLLGKRPEWDYAINFLGWGNRPTACTYILQGIICHPVEGMFN